MEHVETPRDIGAPRAPEQGQTRGGAAAGAGAGEGTPGAAVSAAAGAEEHGEIQQGAGALRPGTGGAPGGDGGGPRPAAAWPGPAGGPGGPGDRPQPAIRVLVAKPGMDRHDRGAKVIARAYRDAGMEVIYTGLHQSPAQIARAALEEDVDVVALSILSGAHNTLIPRVCQELRRLGLEDVLVLVGGVIPQEDVPGLLAAGVARVFGPGSSTDEIVAFTRQQVLRRRGERL